MAEDRFGGKYKTVQDSYTECTHCVLSSDINGTGRLFGGRMMEMKSRPTQSKAVTEALAPAAISFNQPV